MKRLAQNKKHKNLMTHNAHTFEQQEREGLGQVRCPIHAQTPSRSGQPPEKLPDRICVEATCQLLSMRGTSRSYEDK